ncbi:hypothetical protein HPB50_027812 [Hyalomma asiaticum]|nr:hypothetical protein HPB50_027812 [Hyalomma asiaticum]
MLRPVRRHKRFPDKRSRDVAHNICLPFRNALRLWDIILHYYNRDDEEDLPRFKVLSCLSIIPPGATSPLRELKTPSASDKPKRPTPDAHRRCIITIKKAKKYYASRFCRLSVDYPSGSHVTVPRAQDAKCVGRAEESDARLQRWAQLTSGSCPANRNGYWSSDQQESSIAVEENITGAVIHPACPSTASSVEATLPWPLERSWEPWMPGRVQRHKRFPRKRFRDVAHSICVCILDNYVTTSAITSSIASTSEATRQVASARRSGRPP